MLKIITDFLGLSKEEETTNFKESPLHMAACTLLVYVSMSHNGFDPRERQAILDGLERCFRLPHDRAEHVLKRAITFEKNAIDLHSFTRVINMHMDQDGRQDIVKFLWQIAYADNDLNILEADAIKKISDLLGVDTRDRIRLKQEVEAELGLATEEE